MTTTDGVAVPGALVALVDGAASGDPESHTRAAAMTTTDAGGGFHLEGVMPGKYALTATSPRAPAGYTPDLQLDRDKPVTGAHVTLAAEGATISGIARDFDGKPAAHTEIRASRISEMAGDIFFTTSDEAGRYTLRLPTADYAIAATAPGRDFELVPVSGRSDQALDLTMQLPVVEAAPPADVVDWMKAHAIPIARPDPGHGLDDLTPLEDVVGDARVVALGEATHGTREFFQLKHRMLELLVTRKGFDVFAIEAGMPEGFDVDDYVLTGRGDPEKALAGLYFWTWNTEEVLDLLHWMRAYNADPRHKKKLKFYGFDMQTPARASTVVSAYLRKVDPELEASARHPLATFAPGRSEAEGAPSKETAASITSVLAAFDARRPAWEKRSSAAEWAVARQHAVVLTQFVRMSDPKASGVRDDAMADNIRWILDHEGPASKMVVWAHNAHIAITDHDRFGMGVSLRKTLGTGMVSIGFAFDRGSFQAMELPFETGVGLREFTVASQGPGGLGSSLSLAGHPIAAFDLRAVPASGAVHDWFTARHPTREIGSGFSEEPGAFVSPTRLTERFDAVVFVQTTTSARPIGGRSRGRTLAAPQNLDFEAPGRGIPASWDAREAATWGYTVSVVDGGTKQGKRSLSLHRAPGRHYGEVAGEVSQEVDARAFAGKRLTVTTVGKARFPDDVGAAHLRVSARGPHRQSARVEITSRDWSTVTATIDIPADATTLSYGIELAGDGTVDVDDFHVDAR